MVGNESMKQITKIHFLVLIIIALFSIGLACIMYSQTQFTPSKEPFPSDNLGFGFFISEDANLTRAGVDNPHIMISNLNYTRRSASVEVTIYFQLTSAHDQRFLYFGFQTPYNVSDIGLKGSLSAELVTPRFSKDGKLIYFEIERSSASSFLLDITFTWQPFLYRTGYSEYKVLIPFALNLSKNEVFKEIGKNIYFNDITVRNLAYSVLSITLPNASTPQIVLPDPDYHGIASQVLWFYWRIDKLWKPSLPNVMSMPTIFVGFEIRELEEIRGNYAFWSGLAFGVGIPVLVQAIVLAIERWRDETRLSNVSAPNQPRKQPDPTKVR